MMCCHPNTRKVVKNGMLWQHPMMHMERESPDRFLSKLKIRAQSICMFILIRTETNTTTLFSLVTVKQRISMMIL